MGVADGDVLKVVGSGVGTEEGGVDIGAFQEEGLRVVEKWVTLLLLLRKMTAAITAPAIKRAPNTDPTTAPTMVPVFLLLDCTPAACCKFPVDGFGIWVAIGVPAEFGIRVAIGVPAEGIGKVPIVVAPMNGWRTDINATLVEEPGSRSNI